MSNPRTNTSTSVAQVEVDDINDILNFEESVVTPTSGTTETKSNIFSRPGTLDFIDEEEDENEEVPRGTLQNGKPDAGAAVLNEIVEEEISDEEQPKTIGRPKTDKNGLVEFFKKQIDADKMVLFDDFDESKQTVDEYLSGLSQKDLDELWDANHTENQNKIKDEIQQQFFEALPQELQYAAKYALDGGTDMKGIFRALSYVEETRELDAADENDQVKIVRQYLQATNFGDGDEIEEQLNEWKDIGTLGNKAKNFKPKLDLMQEEILQQKIQEQEQFKAKQKDAADAYVNNVFTALKGGELSGLKLDKTTQQSLYSGLTQATYKSLSGRNTNQLGHLLEKYQYGETANHGLIAEALYLLSNPEQYRESLRKQGGNAENEKIVRTLKTEQSRKKGSAQIEERESTPGVRKIAKPVNIFKR